MNWLFTLIFLFSGAAFSQQKYTRSANSSARSEKSSAARSLFFALGAGGTLTSESQFTSWNGSGPGGSVGGFGHLTFASANYVDLKIGSKSKMATNYWGGLRYYFPKKQKYRSTRGGNGANVTTIYYSGDDVPKLQTTELYFDFTVIGNKNYYIGGGLNYSKPDYKEASGYAGTISTSGGIGYELLAGWFFFDGRVSLDFAVRKETLQITFTDAAAGTTDVFDEGATTFSEAGLSFWF